MIVAGDIGKNLVKGVSDGQIDVFPSTLYSYDELNLQSNPRKYDFDIEFKGQKYIGGTLASDEGEGGGFFNPDVSKNHDETLINLLLLLSLTNDDKFQLILGTPISKHDENEKMRLKQKFQGRHNIKINGEQRTFYIDEVEIGPEGATSYFALPKEQIIQGFDFGSTTINYFGVDGFSGRFINKISGTFGAGGKVLKNSTIAGKAKEAIVQLRNVWKRDAYTMVFGGWGKEAFPVIKEHFINAEFIKTEGEQEEINFYDERPFPKAITLTVEGLYELGLMRYA